MTVLSHHRFSHSQVSIACGNPPHWAHYRQLISPSLPTRLHSSMWIPGPIAAGCPQTGRRGGRKKVSEPQLHEPSRNILGHATVATPYDDGVGTSYPLHRQDAFGWAVALVCGAAPELASTQHRAAVTQGGQAAPGDQGWATWGPPCTGHPWKREWPWIKSWKRATGVSSIFSTDPSPLRVILNSPKAAFCNSIICYAWFMELYLAFFFFLKWSSHYLFFHFLRKLLKPTIHSYGNMPWPINYFIPSYSDTKGKKAFSKVWVETPEEGESPEAGEEPA